MIYTWIHPLFSQASDSDLVIKHPPNESEVAIFAFTSKPDMFSKNTVSIESCENCIEARRASF